MKVLRDTNCEPIALFSRSPKTLMVDFPNYMGISLHRTGGMSFIGVPRRGGTTVAWGMRLKRHMEDCATRQAKIELGPFDVYSGEDF